MHGIFCVIVLLAPAIILPCDCFVSMPVISRPMMSLAAASHDDRAPSCASSVAGGGKPILCKTVETFKLADLYHLELSIKASLCGMSCNRFGIDPATGSSLLLLSDQARDGLDQEELSERGTFAHTYCENLLTISKSQSVEWIGLELASAGDAEGLVDVLRKKADEVEMMMRDQVGTGTSANSPQDVSWTLEYTRIGNIGGHKNRPRHTSKTLCHGVANALKLPPELDAKSDSASSLVILDGPDKIRLCLVMSGGKSDTENNGATCIVQKEWPGRPFQYSSAMNPTAASIIVDILLRMCEKDKMDKTPTLLDPTCGSGTFLAFALANSANAIGWDITESCCKGTRRNLEYLTEAIVSEGMEPSSSQLRAYRIDNQDAAQVSIDALGGDEIDCAVANLPWGQNTPTYYEENNKILKALRRILRSDAAVPVAIISRDSSVQKELERIGFRVLGAASIPQSNFRLPKTSKKKKKREEVADDDGSANDDHQDRSSVCMVTIAVTD